MEKLTASGPCLPESSDSDTSSESDIAEITDLREMREIISRMDEDDDGADHDKYGSLHLTCPSQLDQNDLVADTSTDVFQPEACKAVL